MVIVADESFFLRRLQLEIDKLKQSKVVELEAKYITTDYCSETDTEGGDHCSDDMSGKYLEVLCRSSSKRPASLAASGESNDDLPLVSLIRPHRRSPKSKTAHTVNNNISMEPDEIFPRNSSKATSNLKTVVGRKRVRLVLSDDEVDILDDVEWSARRLRKCSVDVAASDDCAVTRKSGSASSDNKLQDSAPVASRCFSMPCNLINIEESSCSYESPRTFSNEKTIRSLSNAEVVIGSDYADSTLKCDINASENLLHRHNSHLKLHATDNEVDVSISNFSQGCIAFRIDDNMINVSMNSFVAGDKISIESLKVELACLYYLQLPAEKRSKGLLPIIQNMEYGGRCLEPFENFDPLRNRLKKVSVDVLINVLNISGNRLTDACGSYLSTIMEKCRAYAMPLLSLALYSLSVERCSITSRTVQKVADALDTESILSQLFIGHNNPISGNAISYLLGKLAVLKRFSELSLNGLKLSKTVVDDLCCLAKISCLSRLMPEGTGIGTDGALGLTHSLFSSISEPLKLDLSFCGVASTYISELNTNAIFISGILELNLQGNPIMEEGGNALASLLMNPQCCLKVLNLNNCQLGMAGILQLVHALAENESLEELNLARNADMDKQLGIKYAKPTNRSSESLQPNQTVSDGGLDTACNKLEVADSEDDEARVETGASGLNDCCASSCQRNSTLECQLVQELSVAIGMAKQLQMLDLSDNGLSVQASEALYNAWSSGSRASLSRRHIEDRIVHFSVEGNKCCRLKPCCKKD
ncbi:hypothetical protein GQ457_14G006280 [Hibiscus cannabinus]